jgi:regulator of replication initiation timing
MTTAAENLLLEQMQKLDKQIEETDRALIHLNKQAGAKLQKLSDLKAERRKLSEAYKELNQPKDQSTAS